ncbi:MAG: hypothetical protein DRG87_03490 [Deltaproteobacteria bacterium]|nr:MAG: hypothetical protein DRG87_03490 [Deltaproteobacteria bacterium]
MGIPWGLPMVFCFLLFADLTEVGRPVTRIPKPESRKRHLPYCFHAEDSFEFLIFIYDSSCHVNRIFPFSANYLLKRAVPGSAFRVKGFKVQRFKLKKVRNHEP